ncbi:MAG TPA: Rieske 2Fe-2S domain-containing protein [Gemmatimonadaceae bacterium]|nr:Rieske 2Fe-2S domain-containing protein [Gemmatimonadaceae bacterium]
MPTSDWHDLGPADAFRDRPVTPAQVGRVRLAVTCRDGEFGVISGVCNHKGGPLGEGSLDGDYVQCPWHNWKYHRTTGLGEPGYEGDAAPAYPVKLEDGRLLVDMASATPRTHLPHATHPLSRKVERTPGPVRVAGISTTNMDLANPRYSTSDTLLEIALEHASGVLGVETRLVRLAALRFRQCEGYYSKSAHACTWPCSITEMDATDQMAEVYEAIVHWADVVLVATPIRWGNASALYYKMIERMNCVQNQITISNRVLIRNKVASFIITGGQDNVQAVAGQMLMFFSEIGCHFPQFPFIAHSRGWSAEDMEHNIDYVMKSAELRDAARALVTRAVDFAHLLLDHEQAPHVVERGGRKAHQLALAEG